MELDYYDYNVVNAGAAPGSYLGMDPAYLVWIPPLDDLEEFEDIRPKQYVDPGSNKESPEEEMLMPKLRRKSIGELTTIDKSLLENGSQEGIHQPKRRKSTEIISKIPRQLDKQEITKLSKEMVAILVTSKLEEDQSGKLKKKDLSPPAKVHKPCEKETEVEKSTSFDNLDDIKFADDCDDDIVENVCNKNSYQDSNIVISNDS